MSPSYLENSTPDSKTILAQINGVADSLTCDIKVAWVQLVDMFINSCFYICVLVVFFCNSKQC